MFTGLIEDVGTIREVHRTGDGARITVATQKINVKDLVLGESIALDGVCLTVVSWGSRAFSVEASPETLRRATLGEKQPGTMINLERALRMGDRLGGHLVTGHVDGVGKIGDLNKEGNALVITIETPEFLDPFLVEKGSVAVDGISLTVSSCQPGRFGVTLIPHTRSATTLAHRSVGDRVNLEGDLMGKYVVRNLARYMGQKIPEPSGIDLDLLKKHGFYG